MSNKALAYVFEHSKTKGSARVLMLAIADMANDDGECWPGKARLEKKVNVTLRNVIKLIQECERQGELAVIERPDTTNRYAIVGMAKEETLRLAREPREKWMPSVEKDTTVKRDTSVTGDSGLVSPVTVQVVSPVTPKPLYNQEQKPHVAGAARATPKQAARTEKPAPKPRPRNLHFDAIVEAFGIDPAALTKTEQSNIGKVAAELKAAGYTPDDIPQIHAYCVRQKFASFTWNALTAHASKWRASLSAAPTNAASGVVSEKFMSGNYKPDFWDNFEGPEATR